MYIQMDIPMFLSEKILQPKCYLRVTGIILVIENFEVFLLGCLQQNYCVTVND